MRASVLQWSRVLVLLGLGAGIMGCASDDDSGPSSGGVVVHPIEERIPYHEQAVPITNEQTVAHLSDSPEALTTLSTFLHDPSAVDTTRLDVLVEESRTIEIASITPNRLVLLAGHPENQLFEHNFRTGTTTQIAGSGGGPGQLKYAEAVARDDTSIYVARQDRRIDRFDCTSIPCTYEETTRLQFSPMAVATAGSTLAVVGSPMLNREGTSMEEWSGAVQVLGNDGSIQRTIGRMYQTDRFLVRSEYIRNSSLIYSDALNRFVCASPKLSFTWTYDENGRRESVRSIRAFNPLALEYDAAERSLEKRYEEGYSTLRLQGPIAGRFVVATVRHLTLPSGASDLTGRGTDYYALDLPTGNTYYLGRDAPRQAIVDRLFLATDAHQVLVENGRVAVVTRNQPSERDRDALKDSQL